VVLASAVVSYNRNQKSKIKKRVSYFGLRSLAKPSGACSLLPQHQMHILDIVGWKLICQHLAQLLCDQDRLLAMLALAARLLRSRARNERGLCFGL
jgi:hypothetical protein